MLFDSHIERRVAIHSSMGLPRWHKRVLYYVFKIRYLQITSKKLSKFPTASVRKILTKSYFNEYDYF